MYLSIRQKHIFSFKHTLTYLSPVSPSLSLSLNMSGYLSFYLLYLTDFYNFPFFLQGDLFSGLNDGLLSRAEALAAVDMQKHQSSHAAHQQMTQQLKVNKLTSSLARKHVYLTTNKV